MVRRALAVALAGWLVLPASAFADSPNIPSATKSSSSSTTKKVVWTIVGASAGFAAGVFLGLNKFDDSINSDRKVWTTAIVGAAAGGVAGALIGRRSVGSNVPVERGATPTRPDSLGVSWESAVGKAPRSVPQRSLVEGGR
jgi:hypothetical protein